MFFQASYNKPAYNPYFSLMIIIIYGIIWTVTMNADNKSRFDIKHSCQFSILILWLKHSIKLYFDRIPRRTCVRKLANYQEKHEI